VLERPKENSQRVIFHLDMDAFYASVEQRDNPDLRGRPVAVGGSNERGVVAAASYEARRFGVRSAMPSITAQRQCPDLVFVQPRFDVYKAVSQQIRAIFAEHTPIIEPLSLDEAYLDVTENLQNVPLARDIALAIRARIKAETGLNASAGISYNKFLAKLASDYRKPNGQYVITPEMGPSFVEMLPVGKFHGIGASYQREDGSSRYFHWSRSSQPGTSISQRQFWKSRRLLFLDLAGRRRTAGARQSGSEIRRGREYFRFEPDRIRTNGC
jgi:nucleotidyltransferase/DNA polymerase involved in DNA repair